MSSMVTCACDTAKNKSELPHKLVRQLHVYKIARALNSGRVRYIYMYTIGPIRSKHREKAGAPYH